MKVLPGLITQASQVVGRTARHQVALYLDDLYIEMLDRLAKKTGRTKQELLSEAVNTLLVICPSVFLRNPL